MDRERQREKTKTGQGAARARFPVFVSVLLAGLACFGGLLIALGVRKKEPAFFQPVSGRSVKEQYDDCGASFGVVKIVCGDFWGSGVVIACEEDGLVIVSAKHLLMYDVQARVSFSGTSKEEPVEGTMDGTVKASVTGQVIGYSASYDLAYLHVSWEALPPAVEARYRERLEEGWPENSQAQEPEMQGSVFETELFWNEEGRRGAVRTDRAYQELRAGERVVQIGMSESASLEYYVGTAQAKEIFISDYNAFMLLNECHAREGMSGGGAFDESGRLIGIIIAGDEQGTVCMPMTVVLREYRELLKEP